MSDIGFDASLNVERCEEIFFTRSTQFLKVRFRRQPLQKIKNTGFSSLSFRSSFSKNQFVAAIHDQKVIGCVRDT